ncbi:hyaluronan and proteoglycan link protein 3-like [Menidia menidia]
MVFSLQPGLLLVAQLLLSGCIPAAPSPQNDFFYNHIFGTNGNKEIHFSGVKLQVSSDQPPASAVRGGNATLPCRYWYEPELSSQRETLVRWSRLPAAGGQMGTDVLVSSGSRSQSFGAFRGRVARRQDFPGDAALVITDLQLNDTGSYRCEVVDGLEDQSTTVHLDLQGVVFPYQRAGGRYQLSFLEARQACEQQDSTLATFRQLFQSWREGLNWCNAGWLADGTVQYPIRQPREPCGGRGLAPGVRTYGRPNPDLHRYDAFCFSSTPRGEVYYLQPSSLRMNRTEAERACGADGARVARVGQLYAAWRFSGLDRCAGGWLADGSVRHPISRPRRKCGPAEPGVRSLGSPPAQQQHGVYCYRPHGE